MSLFPATARATLNLVLAFAVGFVGGILIQRCEALAQGRGDPVPWQRQQPHNTAPCWPVPNGVNNTIQCSNGYFRTITPEGEEFTGMGITDPNGTAVGGNFVINPSTGGPNINPNLGPMVRPPYQAPSVAPGQAEAFGNHPRQ